MVEEYDSIMWNSVWDVVPRPGDKSVVTSRWLYKVEGINYDEISAPVARYSLIRSILALSTQMGWKIHQMDVKTTFLNGEIEEEVYIEKPEGFETSDHELHVCQLKWELYGLKQAPRAWYTRINNYFTRLSFTKSEADVNLYHIMVEGKLSIIVLYVDDLILTSDDQLIKSCKEDLAREFEMKDMGLMHYFLGMEVWQRDGELFVSQGMYANEILRRFHMEMCKSMETPLASNWKKEDATSSKVITATVYRQLVGSLVYLVNTQPDLCFAVNQLSQAIVLPSKLFWKATKHVLRYLRGTTHYGLWYRQTEGVKLQGFTDVDWVGIPSDRKRTSRGIFNLGSDVVSQYSRKQRSIALNSAVAEYMAASQAACEAIWMWKILVGLFGQIMDLIVIYCDNHSCIKISQNPVFHDKSKHIDIYYHHLRDCVVKRIMMLLYISTKEQGVDILTKALSKGKFEFHRDRIEVADNPFLVEREC
eukprot:PITA_14468